MARNIVKSNNLNKKATKEPKKAINLLKYTKPKKRFLREAAVEDYFKFEFLVEKLSHESASALYDDICNVLHEKDFFWSGGFYSKKETEFSKWETIKKHLVGIWKEITA